MTKIIWPRIWNTLRILLLIMLLGGCAIHFGGGYSADEVDSSNNELSIVYGYIDMKNAPSDISWAHIWQYKPNNKTLYTAAAEDGLFWHMGLGQGAFQLAAFGSKKSRFYGVQNNYHLGWKKNNATSIKISKPSAYYMGSYRYVKQSDGYSLDPIKGMLEQKLLKQLLAVLIDDYSKYKHQIALVKQRLNQLGQ